MELSRRRFMQAAGVVAAGVSLDLELPTPARAVLPAPMPLTGRANLYGAYGGILPADTTKAIQSFGFNGGVLYVAQAEDFLRIDAYAPAYQGFCNLPTSAHGGQIGVSGSTIWVGEGGKLSANPISTGPHGGTVTNRAVYTPTGAGSGFDVNTDGTYLALRNSGNQVRLYLQALVENLGKNVWPPSIGSAVQIPNVHGKPVNVGHAVMGTWLYWATQTAAQQDPSMRQITAGYANFVDSTAAAHADFTLPNVSGSSFELEGMAIHNSTPIVGMNNGPTGTPGESPKSFSLIALS